MKNNIKIKQIKFSNENNIIVILSNDKNIHIPKNYTERLSKSDINDIKKYRILPDGYGIHFENIDEDITIKPFLSNMM